jgi:hypothetical protein
MSKSKTVTKAAPSARSNAELDAPLTLTPEQIEAWPLAPLPAPRPLAAAARPAATSHTWRDSRLRRWRLPPAQTPKP